MLSIKLDMDRFFQKYIRQKQERHTYYEHHVCLPRFVSILSALIDDQQADETHHVKHHGYYSVRYELLAHIGIEKIEATIDIC